METESLPLEQLQKVEELAKLLLTPSEIVALLGIEPKYAQLFEDEYTDVGRVYRKVLAEKAKELHEQTLKLASVGSPTAIETANEWLRQAKLRSNAE